MANVIQQGQAKTTTRLLFVLFFSAAFFTGVSIVLLAEIVHSYYVAGYYTLSALFDAVGIDESTALTAAIPFFSPQFYLIIGISIVDGLIKIFIIGLFIAAFIDMLTNLDIGSKITGLSKKSLKNHVIVCGYSFLAEKVALELTHKKAPFIIIDRNPTKVDEIREVGYTALHEDFTYDTTLKNAGIDSAKAIMFLTVDDYSNLLGVITARHLNSKLKIIARAGDPEAITKIHRAGAELCVVPEVLAGIDIGDAIISKVKI